ncbi:MAG: bifunctional 4-hydroxy-2-oxoglutarate aldolase/2-dehydro-3-deoxy-phosphogluconate aldolase [Planctomycetes bacterium]|nr:bifunctional 4-hydroxy-2-oxoglutarate aldolase/2-dehydro-3-deoxy-phosphogluconate aldolase [Planctomycetota bacterium]
MAENDCFRVILRQKIVSIVRASHPEDAENTVRAIAKGGIKAIEISLNTPGALKAIGNILADKKRDFFIGVGTVLELSVCKQLLRMGVDFLVSPVADEKIIRLCKKHKKVMIPGAFTPTEILNAQRLGADLVKIFPVSSVGALYIKDLKTPFPDIHLVATGQVNSENINEYFEAGASAAAIGGAIANPKAISEGNFASITRRAEHFLKLSEK